MVVNHKIEMDLAKPARMPRVDTVHKDQYSRKLELILFENGKTWKIPEDVSILISFIRSDGTGGSYDTLPSGKRAWEAVENKLTVELAPDILAVPGAAMMAVDLLHGSSKVSTFTIMLYVRRTIFTRVGQLEDYFKIAGFLPMPDTAKEGQFLQIARVDENGGVAKLDAITLPSLQDAVDAALLQAKESGAFDGASAYDAAVESGYTGTEEQWAKVMKQLANGIWNSVTAQAVHLTRSLTTDGGITVNFNGNRLRGVSNPREDKDAANKRYVDALAAPYAVPSYWQTAVDSAVAKIKEQQETGGADCMSFVWFSACNVSPGSTANTGKIVKAVMDSCCIPFALLCGDLIGGDADSAEESYAAAEDMLKPIGWKRLLQTQGGQDTFLSTGQKRNEQYLYNAIYRRQTMDSRRVFGEDGTYFYVDYPIAKVRFVMLNAYQAAVSTSVVSFGLGNTQRNWLEHTALAFPETGWLVIIGCHVMPDEEGLQDREQLQQILSGFVAGGGQIGGYFCGNRHADEIHIGRFSYPAISITSNAPAAENVGTDTEHAVDIVTINRNSRTVSLTRLGVGEDRSFSY